MSSRLSHLSLLVALSLIAGCKAPAPQPPQSAAEKPKITKLDDLPRHTYEVKPPVANLIQNEADFFALEAKIHADVQSDLNSFTIEDKTTLKRLKGTLLGMYLLEGKSAEARQLISELRDLEDKPSLKYTTGLLAEVRLDVMDRLKSSNLSSPEFQKAFGDELHARVSALPWADVQDVIKSMKGSYETLSENLMMGSLTSQLDPVLKQTGTLSNDLAPALLGVKSQLQYALPLKDTVVRVLTQVVQEHNILKPDIWAARNVSLTPEQKLNPVVIGIWDSGVDESLYPDQLFTNPNEKPDGIDNDNNGFIDDIHGIAFDLHSNHVTGSLFPLGDKAKEFDSMKSALKGMLDIRASVDSPEASDLKKKLGTIQQDQVQSFFEDLGMFSNFAHGTHVAGISSEGNPYARLLIARITFDYHMMPEKPTIEQARKDAQAYQDAVDYFKAHQVRVVNMSWGGSLKDVEEALEKNGVKDPADRAKQAREIFQIGKVGLYNALKNAPDILFVAAAGNSNNDVNFDEEVPSSFELPNFITVGAVDQAGEVTSFTSFGKNVVAYANGFQVESYIPGGTRLKLSGTSMAAPQVTNLAGKLFAIKPSLTPVEVEHLIHDGLDATADQRVFLLNPKKSVELLQNQKN